MGSRFPGPGLLGGALEVSCVQVSLLLLVRVFVVEGLGFSVGFKMVQGVGSLGHGQGLEFRVWRVSGLGLSV